jgi:two-component system, cell cycle sensor histidine kinase and response regulator CckA
MYFRECPYNLIMKSEERYMMFFENSKEAVFVTTPEGRYIDMNPAGVELFGYESKEEMLGLNIDTDIFADPEARKAYVQKLAESGYVKDYRMELKRKDGRRLIVLTTASVIRDEKGDIIAYQGINHDITEREQEKDALQENMERLDLALKSANMGVWHVDIPNDKLYFSEQSFNLLGIDPKTFTGTHKEFLQAIHPDDRERMKAAIGRILQGNILYTSEYRVIWPDGSIHYITGRGKVIRDDAGNPVKLHGIHWDMTERKRAEQALAESEERLKLTLNAAHIVAWEINVDGSHYETGPVYELFGKPAGFYHPGVSDLFESIHPEDRQRMKTLVQEALRGEKEYQVEYRVPQSDGTVGWIEAVGTLQRDARGTPTRILGIARNITEHKRMDEALRQSEERFKRLVQNSNDIITLMDEKGFQTSISGPLERVTGYKPEELTGKNAFELIHPDDVENAKKIFTEALRQPEAVRTFEYRHRHKNGKWISMEAVGSNLLYDPVVKAIVVNSRNISERNRLQEQLQQAMKMEAIGRLAGGIAHDFNNILTVISGNIELARMDINLSDAMTRCLDQMMKASDSAASLTRQLLAFSRRQLIEPKVLNLNDLIRNVRQMLARLIGENIELKIMLFKDIGSVRVDPGQFEQVLVNLAVNGRDAMPDGGKLVIETSNITLDESYCSIHQQAQPGNFVMLCVSDTGHGMSAEVKEHIFEPFFTTKTMGHGTGLGLATIFGVVRQAGGSIEVYSEADMGTTFKIFLPLIEKQAVKLVKEKLSLDKLKGDETILLVEDEESVRHIARKILNDLGYMTIEACNGEEALILAEKHDGPIHLLMTDIVMPGMNGRELSEKITILYPEIKVLFTSGYTEDVIVHHGVVEAQLNFIGKPYSLQALAAKIREALGPGK